MTAPIEYVESGRTSHLERMLTLALLFVCAASVLTNIGLAVLILVKLG